MMTRIHPVIRPVQPEDNPALTALIVSVLQEFGCSGPGYACNDAETQAMYEAYQAPDRQYYVIVDEATDQVLGGGGFSRLKGTAPQEGICELQKLYFDARLRGLGMGKILLDRLMAEASLRGYRDMYLETVPQMTSAIRLYERAGFVLIDTHRGNTGHAGNCPVYMIRPLALLVGANG